MDDWDMKKSLLMSKIAGLRVGRKPLLDEIGINRPEGTGVKKNSKMEHCGGEGGGGGKNQFRANGHE